MPSYIDRLWFLVATCNCIVCIVLVKSGSPDIHVVVVCLLTPGDDCPVVSWAASVISFDACTAQPDTFEN